MEKDKSKKSVVFFKGIVFGFLLCLALITAYFYAPAYNRSTEEISRENALEMVRNGEVSEIDFAETHLTLKAKNTNKYLTTPVSSDAMRIYFEESARATGTEITNRAQSKTLYMLILLQIIPYALLIGTILLLIVIYNKLIKRKVEK